MGYGLIEIRVFLESCDRVVVVYGLSGPENSTVQYVWQNFLQVVHSFLYILSRASLHVFSCLSEACLGLLEDKRNVITRINTHDLGGYLDTSLIKELDL